MARLTALALAGAVFAFVSLGSCRRTAVAPPAACTKMGQTCQLGPGLLGVCAEGAAGTCTREPCLVCTGQH